MRSYYVIVAWIWSIIWYLGLDPIKWMMMYALNEDGIRNKKAHKEAKRVRSERQLASTGLAFPTPCCMATMQARLCVLQRQDCLWAAARSMLESGSEQVQYPD